MKNQRRILAVVLCVLMLVTAMPLSPVMADDTTGTTEAVVPVEMLDGKELGDAVSLAGGYKNFVKSFDHQNECWQFVSGGTTGNGDDDYISLAVNVPASAHYVKLGLWSSSESSDNLNVVFNNGTNNIRTWSARFDLPYENEGSLNGFVFNAADITGGESGWDSLSFESGTAHTIKSLRFKPTKGAKTSGVTLKFKYIAFFNSAEEANAYVYAPTRDYTVTYYAADGTTEFAKAYYTTDINTLVHITATPAHEDASYVFDGWYTGLNDGTEIKDGSAVTGNISLYPHYVQVKDVGAIYDVNNMNPGIGGHLNKTITKTDGETYFRFTPKQAYEAGTSGNSETKIYFYFSNTEGIKMLNYPIMMIEYRAKAKTGVLESNMSTNGSDEVWGGNTTLSGSASTWTRKIFDLNNSSKFFTGGSPLSNYDLIKAKILELGFPNNYIARLALGQNVAVDADDYLEVRYIGFFSSEDAANNYTYSSSTNWYKVDFVSWDKTTSSVFKEGSSVTFPTTKPEKEGYSFIGWYDAEVDGNPVTEITNLSADTTLFARFVAPSVLYDQHALKDTVKFAGTGYQDLTVTYDETDKVLKAVMSDDKYDDTVAQQTVFPKTNVGGVIYTVDVPAASCYVRIGMTANTGVNSDNILVWAKKGSKTYGPMWSWAVNFAAGGTGVINASTGTGNGIGWATNGIADGGSISQILARPYAGSTSTDKAEITVKYIAFFDSKTAAENYVYAASEEYKVEYIGADGNVIEDYTQYYSKLVPSKITLPDAPKADDGYVFTGWYYNGEKVAEDTIVTENMTITAEFKKVEAAVVITANDMTVGKGNGDLKDAVKTLDSDGRLYWRNEMVSGATSGDNTRVIPTFTAASFSHIENFSCYDYHYVKIGYRTNIASNILQTNPQTVTSEGKVSRLWFGDYVKTNTDKNIWTSVVIDLHTFTDGNNIVKTDGKFDAEKTLAGIMQAIVIKPYNGGGTAIIDGEYFDTQYVAFFDDEAVANAYSFNETYDTFTVTYNTAEAESVTISGGAKLSETTDDEAKTTTVTYVAKSGTSVTLTAVPSTGCKMDGWYNVTNGHNIQLSRDAALSLTVSKDTALDLRFYDDAVETQARLVVLPDEGRIGTITAEGVNMGQGEGDSWLDIYVGTRNATKLTATPNDPNSYYVAFWQRLSDEHVSLLTVGDTLYAYPLGNSVFYQPVYGTVTAGVNDTYKLYVDYANSIIGFNPTEAPAVPERTGYTNNGWKVSELGNESVIVYVPDYVKAESDSKLTINGVEQTNVKFNDEVPLDANNDSDFKAWLIQIGDAAPVVLSYKSSYTYYHILSGNVTITKSTDEAYATPVNMTKTLQVNKRDGQLEFVSAIDVLDGYTLEERGVLLSKTVSDKDSLKLNTAGVIEGKIETSADSATAIYMVAKRTSSSGETWYGRAYMIVRDAEGNSHTIYADEILSGQF